MKQSLSLWRRQVLSQVRGISEHARHVYSDNGRLPHYQTVSESLYGLYRDPLLARAGFLHGIDAELLASELPEAFEEELLTILRERDQLASLDLNSPVDRHHLETVLLPNLEDSRSAVLFVVEQLHHVDPDLEFAKWVSRFHRDPVPVPPGVPAGPVFTSKRRSTNPAEYNDFLGTVVASTARYFGLWHEKNVLEDVAFLRGMPNRFSDVVEFAQFASRDGGICDRLIGETRRTLEATLDIHWEWRHAASMNRWLPRTPWQAVDLRGWAANLHRCGFVTIICPDEETCYQSLRQLHARFQHRDSTFRDTLARPTRSGYRALHTEIVSPGLPEFGAGAIAIRILTRSAEKGRFDLARRRAGESIPPRPTDSREIQVFAPDGRAVVLPIGSTVLNFAYLIHSRLPVYVRGAQVNRQPASLLRPLTAGDVVWLDIDEEPRALPADWEHRVPPETVPQIEEGQRLAMRQAMISSGQQRLREYLSLQGIGTSLDESRLDEMVEQIDLSFERRGKFRKLKGKDWWYREFGLYEAELKGEMATGRMTRNASLRNDFLDALTKAVILREAAGRFRVDGKTILERVCGICRPTCSDRFIIALQDDTLFLHRDGAPCARGSVVTLERHFPGPQYVVVVGTDRAGLAAEFFGIVARYGIGIEHLVGLRLNQGAGIIRVRLDAISPIKINKLILTLRQIPGATVFGPNDPAPSQERLLSTRQKGPPGIPPLEDPYDTGGVIESESRFYGMGSMLANLGGVLRRISSPSSPYGAHAFVHGPKRTGKTSSVLQFLRRLERDENPAVLSVYALATTDGGWAAFSKKLSEKLIKAAVDRAASTGVPLYAADLRGMPLVELAILVRKELDCSLVIAIDEAVHLMTQASKSEHDENGIVEFASSVREVQGILTIWIGPTSIRNVPESLSSILQLAKPIRIPQLSEAEVRSLLRAENHGLRYGIHVDDALSERVYDLAGGNAYWVGWLASHMWTTATRRPDGPVEFTSSLLEGATLAVAHDPTPFVDRYKVSKGCDPAYRVLFGAALIVFADAARNATRIGSEHVISGESLARRIGLLLHDSPPEAKTLREILQDLLERGSIIAAQDATGHAGWRVPAPLFARHILTESGGEAQWLLQ